MASSTRSGDDAIEQEIHLTKEGDWWVAKDVETGVASQGETRQEALEMLDEAVALHKGEIGEPIEDEEAFLEELGIDPDEVEPTKDLPDFMK
ncbi:MAG: type II toxin-antitoxin system HicB family antitoxin [Halorhabdus sp.]